MGSWPENIARVQERYKFGRQEIIGLVTAAIVTGFIFSFRDWGGDTVKVSAGVVHLLFVTLIAAISFWFRVSCQKIYALIEGYQVDFKIWWTGLGIALIAAFLSRGYVSLVLIGTFSAAFISKYRLGEFRHGYSSWNHAMMAYWGLLGHLILALLFGLGSFFLPQNYFFQKGLILNIIAGFCNLIPIPQLDGLHIYYGRRTLYYLGLIITILAAALLLTKTGIGLIIALVVGIVYAIVYLVIGSEK